MILLRLMAAGVLLAGSIGRHAFAANAARGAGGSSAPVDSPQSCRITEPSPAWTLRAPPGVQLDPVAAWGASGDLRLLVQIRESKRTSDPPAPPRLAAMRLRDGALRDSATLLIGRYTDTYEAASLSWPRHDRLPTVVIRPRRDSMTVHLATYPSGADVPTPIDDGLTFAPSSFGLVAADERMPLRVATGRSSLRQVGLVLVDPTRDPVSARRGSVRIPLKFSSGVGPMASPRLAGLSTFRGEDRRSDAIEFHALTSDSTGWTSVRSTTFVVRAQDELSTPLLRASASALYLGWIERGVGDSSQLVALSSGDDGASWTGLGRLSVTGAPLESELWSPRPGVFVALSPWFPTERGRRIAWIAADGGAYWTHLSPIPRHQDFVTIPVAGDGAGMEIVRGLIDQSGDGPAGILSGYRLVSRCRSSGSRSHVRTTLPQAR